MSAWEDHINQMLERFPIGTRVKYYRFWGNKQPIGTVTEHCMPRASEGPSTRNRCIKVKFDEGSGLDTWWYGPGDISVIKCTAVEPTVTDKDGKDCQCTVCYHSRKAVEDFESQFEICDKCKEPIMPFTSIIHGDFEACGCD